MRVGEVMTTGAATVGPDQSLGEAARLILEHRISGLPVVDSSGSLVGIFTEHDFLRKSDGDRSRWLDTLLDSTDAQITARDLREQRVQDVMSTKLITIDVESSVEDAMDLLEEHSVKRLPVLSDGKLVGIVSRANLIEAVLRRANSSAPPK